jgi:Fic-DOC domain mobile mystery protein B
MAKRKPPRNPPRSPQWNSIPGETPIHDISGLKLKGLRTRAQLNDVEAQNIRKAVMRYLIARPSRGQAPFTLQWCYKLHKQMFGEVWRWAGRKRTTELNLGVPSYRIDVDLQILMDDLSYWREKREIDVIEQAARLHHGAVFIHPFLNGNGRWARLLANVFQKQSSGRMTIWPEQTVGNQSVIRQEYLAAVRAADGGDYAPLILLHKKYLEPSADAG